MTAKFRASEREGEEVAFEGDARDDNLEEFRREMRGARHADSGEMVKGHGGSVWSNVWRPRLI